MCNSCVKAVQTVSKNHKDEHILCAAYAYHVADPGQNHHSSTFSTQTNTPYFSTQNIVDLHLLEGALSTVCTGPITNTPN